VCRNEEESLAREMVGLAFDLGTAKSTLREAVVRKYGATAAGEISPGMQLSAGDPLERVAARIGKLTIIRRSDTAATAGTTPGAGETEMVRVDGGWLVDGSASFRAQGASIEEVRTLVLMNKGLVESFKACIPLVERAPDAKTLSELALKRQVEVLEPYRKAMAEHRLTTQP
jgi:hypothetical protein